MKNWKDITMLALVVIVGVLLALFLAAKATQLKQARKIAESELTIERLNSQLAVDSTVVATLQHQYKDLVAIAQESEKKIAALKQENKKIYEKYAEEILKVKELPAKEAVRWLLDVTDCREFPVLQYDDSPDSTFIIPLKAIKASNVISTEAKYCEELNNNLAVQVRVLEQRHDNDQQMLDNRNQVIDKLNSSIGTHQAKEAEYQKQIAAWEKMYKKERIRLRVVQATGVVAIIAAALLL